MTLAVIYSRTSRGIEAPLVTIEVHLSPGLPSLAIVGLPETAVKESKDRVRSALINSQFEFPNRRITVNLAPADVPKKDGGRFDLPIALGILAASQQIPLDNLAEFEFAGELALDGAIRSFHGALPFALATSHAARKLVIPAENANEAALSQKTIVLPIKHILDVCAHLTHSKEITPYTLQFPDTGQTTHLDLADIYGQAHAKRALAIAAAGQHSMLMIGPPGTGKTMLASRLPGILPIMSDEESIESAAINSICGKSFDINFWRQRPFRSPHHTASSVALVGGGNPPCPGEISLAHNGVLFLDELPEFSRQVLEALREPMESGSIIISRAAHQTKFPTRFQLIAAMNPCPCGNLGNHKTACRCTPEQIHRYQARISGPLLNRIDLHVEVPTLPKGILSLNKNRNSQTENTTQCANETSTQIQQQIVSARQIQISRAGKANAFLNNEEISRFCQLKTEDHNFLENTIEHLNLSVRVYHRILKVARTIADYSSSTEINLDHISEALSYRHRNI